MRFLPFFAFLAATAVASAESAQRIFKQSNGLPSAWSINENHSLIWEGKPYIPIGLRISGHHEAILAAKAQGVRDVLVELPSNGMGWQEAVETLERTGMRYMIAIDSMAPGAAGYAIEPQSYRVMGITSKTSVDLRIPGAESALVVLALRRDGSITMSRRVKLEQGRLKLDVESPNQLEHVLLVYPDTPSVAMLDAWDGLDDHRDSLLRVLRQCKFGPGMRGIVNPMGAMLPQLTERLFVPKNSRFQSELAAYLEQRYRNVESVQRAWSMSVNDATTFTDLARLVPLWSGSRGVQMLWDPKTDKLIPVESRRSVIWNDVRSVVAAAESKRFARLIDALRQVCDVPVIQEWVGWSSFYERQNPSLDGIAARCLGTSFTSVADGMGRAASTAMRWNKPGLLIASNVDLTLEGAEPPIPGVVDDIASAGIRGIFFRTQSQAHVAAIVAEANRRGDDSSLAQTTIRPLYFPENALNPAHVQRLPGGFWWLPSPDAGNRIDLGSQFTAYRISGPNGSNFVIWSTGAPVRSRILATSPDKMRFLPIGGIDPDPKIAKGKLDLTIGPSPMVIEGAEDIPVPQLALDEALIRFAALIKEAEKYKMDASEEAFSFRDAYTGLERNPGGSFNQMAGALSRLNARLARYMWIEAEAFRESTFSEVVTIHGTSGNAVLNLRSPFEGAGSDYFAEYAFTPRSGAELEVWIAARIPRESRKDVNLMVGSQLLKITTEPVSHYGSGFGWYKLGTTRLGGVQSVVQLRVFPQLGAEMAIDTILFHPGPFSPKGVKQPDAIPIDLTVKPPKPDGE